MSANVEAMIREGINAVKAGNKEEGRVLLLKAVELDPYNEEGWLWLSGVVDSPDDQRTCLENVLSINPNNDRARQGVAYLTGKPATAASPPATLAPAPLPPASPRPPTSVEWDMPATETSSPSATWRPGNEPSAAEYDDWVSALNLPSTPDAPAESGTPFSVPAFSTASPFLGGDDDDDLFDSGPFSSAPVVEEAPPAPAPAPSFSFQQPPAYKSVSQSPPPPHPAPPKSKEKRKAKAPPRKSPATDAAFPAELKEVDAFFDNLGAEEESVEESELFGYIPKEIKSTRLPGTRERTPFLLVVAALLLIILNIGVATLLVMRFLTPV
jgi:hypothetical protein